MITRAWPVFLVVAACSGDESKGTVDGAVTTDVAAETAAEATIEPTEVAATETSIDTIEDTELEAETGEADTTEEDTEVEAEVVTSICGNGVLEGSEACDDGDECAADGCADCAFEPATVMVELALDDTLGWDLDDADGDSDASTGIDNRMAETDVVRATVNGYIADYIQSGTLVQLAALGHVSSLAGDDDVELALFAGQSCSEPPPWLEATDVEVERVPEDFDQCVAKTLVDDSDDPDNGIYAEATASSPAAPWLRAWVPMLDLPVGPLGILRVARARFEAHIATSDGVLTGLEDGRLGGVIPASALARIDTSTLLPRCPTALHAVLGLAGHIDQDAEGNGTKDFILWTSGAGVPCITADVNITGCCDDGDCAAPISGEDCVFDSRIGDGFSAAFRVRATAVHVTGPVTAACP